MHEVDLLWRLGLALALSSLIGLERELRQKSAGLRTNALVGVGAAAFMLVSAYGFSDVLGQHNVVLDPSRIAAQIVSGIGFIGGGIIFVRHDAVRGLTTAAGVWISAAVGMACGGDLPIIATATAVIYLVVSYGFDFLVEKLPGRQPAELHLVYLEGHGALREAVEQCVQRGFSIAGMSIRKQPDGSEGTPRQVSVELELRGKGSLIGLADGLQEMSGILDVRTVDPTQISY